MSLRGSAIHQREQEEAACAASVRGQLNNGAVASPRLPNISRRPWKYFEQADTYELSRESVPHSGHKFATFIFYNLCATARSQTVSGDNAAA